MNILDSKQYKSYNYFSRYSNFPFYYNTLDKKYIYGTTSQLSQDTPYVIYKIKANDTLDSIALQYYNNPTLYWVLCDFNRIQDPFITLEEGETIKIPTLNGVTFKEY